VGSPEVGVLVVAAEGRDLEDVALAPDADRPEPVLIGGSGEDLEEAVGACVGGEVPVGGGTAEGRIPE
jgi:hypothetical protein